MRLAGVQCHSRLRSGLGDDHPISITCIAGQVAQPSGEARERTERLLR